MTPRGTAVLDVLRVVRRRRGLLAAGLAAGAVATALPQLAPPAPPGLVVLAAARDLRAGASVQTADVVRLELPASALPDGALTDLPSGGVRVAGAVRRGEPLTDVRLLGAALLDPDAGLVASAVRVADPAGAALVQAGDRVDVLAASPDGGSAGAARAAADVLVLSVPAPDPTAEGGLLVLATTPATASRLAAAAVSSRLSVVVLPRARP